MGWMNICLHSKHFAIKSESRNTTYETVHYYIEPHIVWLFDVVNSFNNLMIKITNEFTRVQIVLVWFEIFVSFLSFISLKLFQFQLLSIWFLSFWFVLNTFYCILATVRIGRICVRSAVDWRPSGRQILSPSSFCE